MKNLLMKKVTSWIVISLLCVGFIPQMSMHVYAEEYADAIIYVADADAGYTPDSVKAGTVTTGTFANMGMTVYRDYTQLSFNKVSEGVYQLSDTGTINELYTDSQGKIRVTGLMTYETGYSFRSNKKGIPSEYYIPDYWAKTNKVGETWYGVLNLCTRQVKAKAVDEEGNGLNGATMWLEDSMKYSEHNDRKEAIMSFVKISDGVYRIAEQGETGTTKLVTGTVKGEAGVVLIDKIKIADDAESGMMVDGAFEAAPAGYGTKVNIPVSWVHVDKSLESEEYRDADAGTATFVAVSNTAPSSENPASQIGYGSWKINSAVSDEFNGDFIDKARWNVDTNYSVASNGMLELKSVLLDASAGTLDVATVESKVRGMGYGYYEARYRGAYIPAMNVFWIMNGHTGNKDNKEIDIAENHPSNKLDPTAGYYDYINSHDWNKIYPILGAGDFETSLGTRNYRVKYPGPNENNSFSDDFYTMGCLYEPDKLTYYINGEVVFIDYVKSAWRSMNLCGYDETVRLENIGSAASASQYTEDEWNNTKRNGFNINTMYVDYFRYYERTDYAYADIPLDYSDDGLTSTLPKTPQTIVEGNWTYQDALSDEFDDNEIDMDFSDKQFEFYESKTGLWKRVTGPENEYNQTMRLPVVVYNKYAADDFRAGEITTVPNEDAEYADGYYEFRGKAANCDCRSSMTITGSTGSLWVELFGDPLDEEFQDQKNLIKFGGIINENKANEEWIETAQKVYTSDLTAGYHVFGLLIKNNTYTLYVDGELFATRTTTNSLGDNIKVSFDSVGVISERFDGDGHWSAGDSMERLMDPNRDTNFYVDYFRYYVPSDEAVTDAIYKNGTVSATAVLPSGVTKARVIVAVYNADGKMIKASAANATNAAPAKISVDCGTIAGAVKVDIMFLDVNNMKPLADAWSKTI